MHAWSSNVWTFGQIHVCNSFGEIITSGSALGKWFPTRTASKVTKHTESSNSKAADLQLRSHPWGLPGQNGTRLTEHISRPYVGVAQDKAATLVARVAFLVTAQHLSKMHARMHAISSGQKCKPWVSACVISLCFFALLFPWGKVATHGPTWQASRTKCQGNTCLPMSSQESAGQTLLPTSLPPYRSFLCSLCPYSFSFWPSQPVRPLSQPCFLRFLAPSTTLCMSERHSTYRAWVKVEGRALREQGTSSSRSLLWSHWWSVSAVHLYLPLPRRLQSRCVLLIKSKGKTKQAHFVGVAATALDCISISLVFSFTRAFSGFEIPL